MLSNVESENFMITDFPFPITNYKKTNYAYNNTARNIQKRSSEIKD